MGKRRKKYTKTQPTSWQSMVLEREHALLAIEENVGCFTKPADKEFCGSLIHQFRTRGFLTDRQWYWVKRKALALKRIQNPPKPRNRLHHVYVIGAGEQVKIGKSTNPEARLKTLQTSNPAKLKLLCVIPVENSCKASLLEKSLHKKCRKYHVNGEWFKWDALFIVEKIAQSHMADIVRH